MATEEEAREAADGQEVQVEAVDFGTAHLQMHLDGKLSSNKEIKDQEKIMDSTEGMLNITEDQVLEEAPSVAEIPPAHTTNGSSASLNDHMEEEHTSNKQPQENGHKDKEQVEASPDGISTGQSNKSNGEEAIDSLGHGKSTTEDNSHLKHGNEDPKEHDQQYSESGVMDDKMVHEDTLKTANDDEPTVDSQQGQNLESARAKEGTQAASLSCIPDDEVVAEAPVGLQTSLEPKVDDADALPDTSDDSTEKIEPAKVDKDSCPEDEDIAEHTDEIVKLEDQQSKQTGDMDADVVQEETPKSKETDVPEDMPKPEQADELTTDAPEVLNQELAEETSHPVCKETEETSHERNMAVPEETTLEHDATTREYAVDIQEVRNQGTVEEMKDAEEADTEKTVQQSRVAFEEAIPEDHVETTEPSSDTQHLDNVESEEIKDLEDAKAEEIFNQSNVAFAEDAVQDKEVLPSEPTADIQQVKQEETKSTRPVEMDEASNQTHAEVFNNLAEEDSGAASEPHVAELEDEVKYIEDNETQEITHRSHVASSEELLTEVNSTSSELHNDDIQLLEQSSVEVKDAEAAESQEICHERTISTPEEDTVEDYVTAEGPTCDAQEVHNVESAEEIKNNTAENIIEVSNMATVEEADEENNVPTSNDTPEQQMRGLEPEEIKNTEPVETEEACDQRHAALFNDPTQDDIIPSEMPETESTVEVNEIEATKTEAIPQESNVSLSEEPASEETTCYTREVNNVELAEDIEGNKHTGTEEISDRINGVFAGEAAQATNDLASEPTADMPSVQELESEEQKNTELIEVSEASHQMDASILENPTQGDNLTTSELHVMESAEVSSNGATEGQETPHQNNVAQSEDQETEENIIAGEPHILEPEPVEEMKKIEAIEPRGISLQSIVSASEESVPENVAAEEPASDDKEIQNKEPELIKEHDNVKAEEISNQRSGTIVGEAAQENKLLASNPTNDVQAKELESHEIRDNEDVGTEDASHQTHAENLTANEPQIREPSGQTTGIEPTRPEPTLHESNVTRLEEIATENNTTVIPDVSIQQHQEQESIELRDTEATEPQGISTSHIVSTSEEFTPEDNVTTEPSANTQADNLESATVTEDTADVKGNVAVVEEENPEEHVLALEATVDILPVQQPELEENKNIEPVDIQDSITPSELPAEEVKDTEAMESEVIRNEGTVVNINELTKDPKSNAALADEAAPEEHVLATEATVDVPPAQEPELEEIKNIEPVEVEDNIAAGDLPEEEEAMETEAIPHESTVANISELTEDVKYNVSLAEEAAREENVLATEATTDVSSAQEPELEEIKNTEPVEVEDNIAARDLPAEEEAMETEAIPHESTVASISELTEDMKCNVALADEAAPAKHVLATDTTVDIPPAQKPELEEIKNIEPVEVEDNIAVSDLPEEEMKDTEAMETEGVPHESNAASIEEYNEDDILTASAPVADIQLVPEQESVEDKKCTDTTEYQGEHQRSIVFTSDELTPTEEKMTVTESICDTHVQNATAQEIEDSEDIKTEEFSDHSIFTTAEMAAQESALLGSEPTSDVQQMQERDSTEETRGIEAMQTEDDQQNGVSTLEKAVPENNVIESEPIVDDQVVEGKESAVEVKDIEAMETKEIFNQSNITTNENVAEESSEQGSDPDFFVQSAQWLELAEDSKGSQLVKAEEPTAEDNAANEIDPPADTEQVLGLELVEGNKDIDATEVKEAFCPSQDVALEEPAAKSNRVTTEPTYDIQQVNDLEEAEEMKGMEAINDEEIPCQKIEIDILEDLSPIDDGTPPKEHPLESNEENLIDNVALANEKIKDVLQEPTEQKEISSDLDEKTVFTTQKSESTNEEDDVQNSGEDIIGTSNNIEQIKEEPKDVTEHDSIQMASDRSEENIADVQDSDIKEEFTERGTAKASKFSVENDPLAGQDVAEKDDTVESGKHTDDQDNEQLHDVVLQMQRSEQSVDALAIVKQDEAVQKVNLHQQQKEDEEIEKQMEEIQTDEQKHDENRADFTIEPLLEPQSIENGTTNREEEADVFEAEQTDTMATEMLKDEQTLHIPQESIPRITDTKVENSTEIKEGIEEENAPNNAGFLYADADAENYNEDEQENTEKDAIVAKTSTDEQDGKTDEIRNKEVRHGLASPLEKYLQKISDSAPSNEEMLENNATVVPQIVESGVHSEEKECINEVNDDIQAIQTSEKEIVDEVEEKQEMQNEDNDVHLDEIQTKSEEGEASELHFISEYAVETSKQNDAEQDEQDLSIIHHKVGDEKLKTTEHNGVEAETDSNEKMETSYTAVTEAVKFDEAISDKASGTDGALSDENLETVEDTRRYLDASSIVTASKGESVNDDKEHHKLALPAHSTLDRDTTEQASGLEETKRELLFPEKPLPAEPEEHEESQITKGQDEEDIDEQEIGGIEKEETEAEQSDLPVSHFLMNLIMGKQSNDPDGHSECEAEKKQEETTKDDSCLITSQQEESLVPIPIEKKVDDKLIFEQEEQNLEGSEETHDHKLETDEELSRNTHDLEAPVCQDNDQDEISSELVPGEAPGLVTQMETRDFKLGERAIDSVCREHVQMTTQIEEGSLKSNLDNSTSPKASQEETLKEGRTDLLHESFPEDSSDAVAEQTLLPTEPDMGDEKILPNDTDDLQQEESIELSVVEAKSTIEAQLENEEVDKEEENQHTTTDGTTEGQMENLHDNSQKGTGSEVISDEQTPGITEPVSATEINLVHEKETSGGSACMEEKQSYKFSNNELGNSEKALEIQSDGPNLHINQDKQDESADNQIEMERNNLLDKPGESNLQEEQETHIVQKSPKGSDEGDQHLLAMREPVIKEENVNKTVESHVQTVNRNSNEEEETFNSQVQERDLDAVSPKDAPEAEEKFVEVTKPEFSTDEEHSPKKDESNMADEKSYDEKIKDEEEAKNFTDEATTKIEECGAVQKASHNQKHDLNLVLPNADPDTEDNFVDVRKPEFSTDEEQSPKQDESNMAEEKSYDEKTKGDREAKNFTDEAAMKIEERGSGQKASPKKHNILSGVGSKVKHQLAKVRKAIVGKPGHKI